MRVEVQEARLEVRGTRVVYGLTCDWCAGHGYEPTEDGAVVSCIKCHGSEFKFQHIKEDEDERHFTSL